MPGAQRRAWGVATLNDQTPGRRAGGKEESEKGQEEKEGPALRGCVFLKNAGGNRRFPVDEKGPANGALPSGIDLSVRRPCPVPGPPVFGKRLERGAPAGGQGTWGPSLHSSCRACSFQ